MVETHRTRYGKLTQTKSGQTLEKRTEQQTWLKDSFSFLRGHIRRKEVSKSSTFKSPQRPSAAAASASVQDTSRVAESEMEISIVSDVTHQPSSTSPKRQQPPVATATTSADPVLDQFQQMRLMLSTFQGECRDPTPSPRQSFCNYLHSEIEHLEERDFLTFRNDSVKLLNEIQYKAEEGKRQVTTSQEVTYQLPQAGHEYILTIPETQPVSIPVVQPTQTATGEPVTVIAKVQQPSRPSSSSAQPTSYVVVDDQQPGTSRQMIFNPPSVAPSQQEETQHKLQDYPVSLELFPVCYSISRSTHHSHFHPLNFKQHRHQCHLTLIMNSQDLPASPASRVRVIPSQQIGLHKSHQPGSFKGHPNLPKTINN